MFYYGYKNNFTSMIEKRIQTDRKKGDFIKKKYKNKRELKDIRK